MKPIYKHIIVCLSSIILGYTASQVFQRKDWVHIEVLAEGNAIVLHEKRLYELKEMVGEPEPSFQESLKRELKKR